VNESCHIYVAARREAQEALGRLEMATHNLQIQRDTDFSSTFFSKPSVAGAHREAQEALATLEVATQNLKIQREVEEERIAILAAGNYVERDV